LRLAAAGACSLRLAAAVSGIATDVINAPF
jgi:hypothetical protein